MGYRRAASSRPLVRPGSWIQLRTNPQYQGPRPLEMPVIFDSCRRFADAVSHYVGSSHDAARGTSGAVKTSVHAVPYTKPITNSMEL